MFEQETDSPPPRREDARASGLDRAELIRLGKPAPARLTATLLIEWMLIVGAIAIAVRSNSAWAGIAAIFFIATRQHALLVLMHEFSHRHFSRSQPALNDAIGDFFCALPFTITIHGFRRDHSAHHRFTATAADPDWASCIQQDRFAFPKSRLRMAGVLMKHCLGSYGLCELRYALLDSKMASRCPSGTRLRQALFAAAVAGGATWFQLWQALALYWLVPMLTVLVAILYLRDVAEHFAMPRAGIEASRTVLPSWWERWLIAPHGVSYHAEHHLCPAVPSSRLPALHALLMREADHAREAVVTCGYFPGLFREIAAFEGIAKNPGAKPHASPE